MEVLYANLRILYAKIILIANNLINNANMNTKIIKLKMLKKKKLQSCAKMEGYVRINNV